MTFRNQPIFAVTGRYAVWLAVLILMLVLDTGKAHAAFASRDISGADYGRHLDLMNTAGKPVSLADYAGKIVVINFGFTSCADICPAQLAELAQVLKLLDQDAKNIAIMFITLDPERDTPSVLEHYLKRFDHRIVGLSGSIEATEAASEEFRIFYEKLPGKKADDYVINHSTGSLIYDRTGKLRLFAPYGQKASVTAADIHKLLTE